MSKKVDVSAPMSPKGDHEDTVGDVIASTKLSPSDGGRGHHVISEEKPTGSQQVSPDSADAPCALIYQEDFPGVELNPWRWVANKKKKPSKCTCDLEEYHITDVVGEFSPEAKLECERDQLE